MDALAERARAGVAGSPDTRLHRQLEYTSAATCKTLLDAGGQLRWYHPLRVKFIPQFNNRTHRELLIVDGSVAFIGGAGIADWWMRDGVKGKRWRDMVVRVEGPSAAALQAVFAQNWLRVSGEILTGAELFRNDTRRRRRAGPGRRKYAVRGLHSSAHLVPVADRQRPQVHLHLNALFPALRQRAASDHPGCPRAQRGSQGDHARR